MNGVLTAAGRIALYGFLGIASGTSTSAAARPAAMAESVPITSRGVLVETAAMSAPRAAHTTTVLPDGRILVVGGFTGVDGAARAAEIFDPAAARFSPLPRMIAPRHSHTATLLANYEVLIVGGFTGGTDPVASVEMFNASTNSFRQIGSLKSPRAGHVAVRLADGRVLIAGGVGPGWNFLSSAEIFDPVTGRLSSTGDMTIARESHAAVLLQDGRVLIVGGHRGRRAQITLYTSAEAYDPTRGTFRAVGDMQVRRHKHDAVRLPDGRVLVSGGTDERDDAGVYRSTELFDPIVGRFTLGPDLQRPRYKHQGSSVLLTDGTLLIGGGAPEAETYDAARNTFTIVGGTARMAGQFSAVAALPRGGALITGGYGNGGGPRANAWIYRPR